MITDNYIRRVTLPSYKSGFKLSGAVIDVMFAMFGRSLVKDFKDSLKVDYTQSKKMHMVTLELCVLTRDELETLLEKTKEKAVKELSQTPVDSGKEAKVSSEDSNNGKKSR